VADTSVDAGSDAQADGQTDTSADSGSDVDSEADSSVSSTGPTRLIPVSGTGRASSRNHTLQLKIGRPAGTAGDDATFELGGQP
jgi:hypothetical protein